MSSKEFKKYSIRYNFIACHPYVLMENLGRYYKTIGITHSAVTHGVRNIPLEQPININDPKKCYFLPGPSVHKKSVFGLPTRDCYLSDIDKNQADKIGAQTETINKKWHR